ncbi:hypothetical protein C1645_744855 [Glomus cerebriforme]|uniref:Uncharacterized protein n=1 Tax=Glomus cerebriforme TaxID=658196 RepID=A0A397S4Q4_9GLOM|nr:hypothetical protein C1645_744855 [Glomus cerebriforme]
MDGNNVLLKDLSEGIFITTVFAPILNKIFIKNKKDWYVKYEETCLADDQNSQKMDDECQSSERKIDAIVVIKEEREEFLVIEVSKPPCLKRLATFHRESNENNQNAEDTHE